VTLGKYVGSLGYPSSGGYTYPKIQGDPANNAAVAVWPTSGSTFTSVNGDPWIISSLKVTSISAYGIVADAHSHLLLSNMNFAYCGLGHMCAEYGGFIETLAGPYTVSGDSPYHITASMRGEYVSQGNAVTLAVINGAHPIFFYFAQGGSGGLVAASQMTTSGPYTSYHTNQVNNDGTALMYAPSTGWP
jgi:hypothetical protein